MNAKIFSQRLNQELSALDLPEDPNEKIKAIVKVFGVTRYLANAMILGHILPSSEQIEHIAKILEVCPQWLSGETDRKKNASHKEKETS